jgi:hypothetical protein
MIIHTKKDDSENENSLQQNGYLGAQNDINGSRHIQGDSKNYRSWAAYVLSMKPHPSFLIALHYSDEKQNRNLKLFDNDY